MCLLSMMHAMCDNLCSLETLSLPQSRTISSLRAGSQLGAHTQAAKSKSGRKKAELKSEAIRQGGVW